MSKTMTVVPIANLNSLYTSWKQMEQSLMDETNKELTNVGKIAFNCSLITLRKAIKGLKAEIDKAQLIVIPENVVKSKPIELTVPVVEIQKDTPVEPFADVESQKVNELSEEQEAAMKSAGKLAANLTI